MANIDRILNLHQSYSLMKIGALNKQMLIAQYAQCEQIGDLQKEIEHSNSVSRKILENQLREIKHRETLKYYKSLAYNMSEATCAIAEEQSITLQIFLMKLFEDVISANIKEAKENLEDISDKNFCRSIECKIKELKSRSQENLSKYENSDFPFLISTEIDYVEKNTKFKRQEVIELEAYKKKQFTYNIKPYKNRTRGNWIKFLGTLFVLSLILIIMVLFEEPAAASGLFILFVLPISLFLFPLIYKEIRWQRQYPLYLLNMEKEKNENESIITELEERRKELEHHPYIGYKRELSNKYQNWQELTELIYSYLPNDGKNSQNDSKSTKEPYKDPLLFDAANYIVIQQQVSIPLIQRKFLIGHNRASNIIKELVNLGVIHKQKGIVLIHDEYTLQVLFNKQE
ncbi:hypothetical protein M2459_003640 [Parabacteroides sp. PF5-5]|uniref:DNA translocase FtsK n=1 Tax=unclassified Parabacteroides TaxID=2649774 RepID=UPI002472F609|nr:MULTISPECIES: DNA translocase FtsK [unclassified Parabacteroides]MDH6306700.1 hypothetical protein [Parabacteroides sp. PH5-39]MDH6316231.1 hypothetical protein [Parabacteroides sp. PF5-13]MDH6321448.1 hypothetical protein [Parabacteroides sp. PH5-13]MDH6325179.1 hypothetical protein [Parabacteroides sp. PH5-8]MDH6329063.1 hypothetical protein [Parabacteroides sp. PH5-41]